MSVAVTSLYKSLVPPEGPLIVGPFAFSFVNGAGGLIDLSFLINSGRISQIMTMSLSYGTSGGTFLKIIFPANQQTIVLPASTSANSLIVIPVLLPNPPLIQIVTDMNVGGTFHFANYLLKPVAQFNP